MNIKNIMIAVLAALLVVAGIYIFTQTPVINAQSSRQNGANTPAAGAQRGAGQGNFRQNGSGQNSTGQSSTDQNSTGQNSTVQIQPASDVLKGVSASGNIALVSQVDVAGQVSGAISQVNMQAGDVVTAGQVLMSLDTTDLQRALVLAQLAVATDQNQVDQLNAPPTAADLATAKANLASAQTALANLQAGPTPAQLAAAQSALAAAQANYNTLVAPPDQNQLDQLKANIQTQKMALDTARRAYEKVAWQKLPGTTSQLAAYQQAQVAYNSAQAAYDQATQPPTNAQVQSALSAIQNAKETLSNLTPTDSALGAAQAQVTSAQSALDTLTQGPTGPTLKAAQLTLKQALINLEQAANNLAQAQIRAPIAGTVLSVEATVGQQIGAGTVVATMADTSHLQLTVNVAEVDITRLQPGQDAQVSIDAFPGQTFQGKVSQITPVSSSTSGIIDYPVTIRLTGDNLTAVRPGMTAVASLAETNLAAAGEWFVPTNALQQQGKAATVTVVRNGADVPVAVTPAGVVQGDWTLVKATDLQAGDQVVGSVTTKIATNQLPFGGGGRGPGGFGGRANRPAP
ncbi:MAG: efflux RND transporter periplasmic adaptor subunit [Caldilineaceae bacterium]